MDCLSEALSDCALVAATSAHVGGLFRKQAVGEPEEILTRFAERLAEDRIALVFGPEDQGLSDEEIAHCDFLIQIPTDPNLPVLNLAQGVASCLYELRRCHLKRNDNDVSPKLPIAPIHEQERAFEQLRAAPEEIGFLFGEKADALVHGLRHLISRAEPTSMELKLLLGLARQIRWHVSQHPLDQAGK